jgi:hypothetical protein
MTSEGAVNAVNALTPGGAFMKATQIAEHSIDIPAKFLKEVDQTMKALNELLTQFWACFPVTTPQLEARLEGMKETLKRFESINLKRLRETLMRDEHENTHVSDISLPLQFILTFRLILTLSLSLSSSFATTWNLVLMPLLLNIKDGLHLRIQIRESDHCFLFIFKFIYLFIIFSSHY